MKIQSSISRRSFLTASLATLLPKPVLAKGVKYPDVVVIGAGAAGLAAAHTLISSGTSTVIVDADSRIGGRAHTDHVIFDVPFDVGAHWLHYGNRNPYNYLARILGFDLDAVPENYRLFSKNQEVGPSEMVEMWETYSELQRAIKKFVDAGKDVAVSEATKHVESRWADTAKFILGPWDMGKDLKDFSTLDWWNSEVGPDYICRHGLGTLVAHFGKALEVSLNTKVEKIIWGGPRVVVETTKGKLKPKAVIVTVSTGVLAANGIEFLPFLPISKQESFHGISMGVYEHIALKFSEDIFEMGRDGYLLYEIGHDGRGFGTLTNASGSGLCYCDVGGDWGRELQRQSPQARIDYALNQLVNLLGSDVKSTFVKGAATAWNQNQWTFGSYASATPGNYVMREILRQPVAERIYFAGEACHRSMWATVGGAHLSGVETAREVSRNLV